MASALFNEAFIIIILDETGQPVQIMPAYTNLSTYLSTCLVICLMLMKTSLVVRNAFKGVAARYPPELCLWRKNMSDDDVVQDYINKISSRFVLVCVAESIKNLNQHACHIRRRYGNDGRPFNSHDQAIVLNGKSVHQMCVAGTRAESFKDPNSKEHKQFQVYLFSTTKSCLHELAHVFVTFLGQGNSNTPPDVIAYYANEPKRSSGEAGRYVEKEIFGGLVTILRNPAEGEDQAGMPHLVTKDGIFQILPQWNHEFLSFQFTLPISPLVPRCTSSIETIGGNQPRDIFESDPLDKLELQQLLADYAANPPRWDDGFDSLLANSPAPKELTAEQVSLLKKVPFDPSLRLEEEPKPHAVAVT